jgi:hypothetical protein
MEAVIRIPFVMPATSKPDTNFILYMTSYELLEFTPGPYIADFFAHCHPCESHNCDADGFFVEPHRTPRVRSSKYIPWPKCGKTVDVNNITMQHTSKAARTKHEVMHYGTSLNKSMLLKCIAIHDIIIDTLHVVLRVTPKLWEVTVVNRSREYQLRDQCQWFFDIHRVIAGSVKVLGSSGGSASLDKRTWPGNTCNKMLDLYESILDET